MPGATYAIGGLTLRHGRQLLDGERTLELGGKALDLLSALAEAGGDVVTKDELMAAVWPGVVVEENAIQVHMSAIRKALRAEAGRLVTVRGRGYRLEASLREAPGRAAEIEQAGVSLAVLPFANLTGDREHDYLADGIAEEIITALSRSRGPRVAARSSSFAYKGRDTDVRTIARDLGVSHAVEGTVRAAGERLRVTAQLIDAATGFHVWAQNFDRAFGDLLALQDELAHAIAGALDHELAGPRRATDNPEAMRLMLQGRSVAARLSFDAIIHACGLLRQAIALDPGFARAHEGLAGTLLAAINTGVLPIDARGEARREAEQALALDPSIGGARAIIACLDALQGRWREAEAGFLAALALDETNSVTHETFAHYVLLPTGSRARARRHAERALELAPARATVSFLIAVCEANRGNYDEAARFLDVATMLGMSERFRAARVVRAGCELAAGRVAEAGTQMAGALPDVVRRAGGEQVVRQVFSARSGLGDAAGASRAVAALFVACRDSDDFWRDASLPGYLVNWQARLGALDAAFEIADALLERRRLTGHMPTASLNHIWMPAMRSFRDDPRFGGFVAGLGMTEYWAALGPPDGHRLEAGRPIAL